MLFNQHKSIRLLTVACVAVLLSACDNGDGSGDRVVAPPPVAPPPVVTTTFEVTVSNLTNGQPLSPIAVIAHQNTFPVFTIGNPASAGLETLAEGGDNSALLAEANAAAGIGDTASGAAPIGPEGAKGG